MEQEKKREERILIMEKLYTYDLLDEFKVLTSEDFYSDYITDIVNYVCNNLSEIDEVITKSLVNYTLPRLSFVDRAIVRMAVAEMQNGLPKAIAINEALEIVKMYSDTGDGKAVRFINKLLDNIAKNEEGLKDE